jgi:hypothetical protein
MSTVSLTSNIPQQIHKGERTKMRRLFIAAILILLTTENVSSIRVPRFKEILNRVKSKVDSPRPQVHQRQQPRKFQGQELKHMNPRITLVQDNSFLQPPPPRSTRHPQQNKLKETASPTKPVFRYRTSPTTTRASTTTYTSLGSSSTFTKSSSTFPPTVKQSTAFHEHVSTTHLPTASPKVSTTLPSITNKSSTVTTTRVSSNDTKT